MKNISIPFNKPYLTGKETDYIIDAVKTGKISGNGKYTQLCQDFLQKQYGFNKCLLTTSCTDALEMAAILANIRPGDEVIMPSFTFVSTANAFVLRGAKIVFCDSRPDHPGMDESKIEALITHRTRAIVPVHYAGVACDMDIIMRLAEKYNLLVIEDAAQAIDSYYTGADGISRPLGSIGHMAAFSFHETKNIISGEGGMLVINDPQFKKRAEIIWEKGTNRSAFFRGEVNKYGWIDIGSSFLPSDIIAAFLYAQLENIEKIQNRRKEIWNYYHNALQNYGNDITLPFIPDFATNNAHMYYLIMPNLSSRTAWIDAMKAAGVLPVFHYQSLHKSKFYNRPELRLPQCEKYTDCLVRLPFYYEVEEEVVVEKIVNIKYTKNVEIR